MGHPDPRLTPSGALDIRLHRLLTAYNRADPPPTRVKPIPLPLLRTVCTENHLDVHPLGPATAAMLTLGFFFLLRPGEYAKTSNPDSTPFRLCDIHLRQGPRRIPHMQCPIHDLHNANFVCLEFTTQKNGVRGELIGHGRSGNPEFCPVEAAIQRITHLRQHHAPPTLPIYSYYTRTWEAVTTTHLTTTLRRTAAAFGSAAGISPSDISVRSLRASGATALFCANVDSDRFRLLGRWRSDEMLRYLHVQAYQVVADLAPTMLQHGAYQLIPNDPLGADGGL